MATPTTLFVICSFVALGGTQPPGSASATDSQIPRLAQSNAKGDVKSRFVAPPGSLSDPQLPRWRSAEPSTSQAPIASNEPPDSLDSRDGVPSSDALPTEPGLLPAMAERDSKPLVAVRQQSSRRNAEVILEELSPAERLRMADANAPALTLAEALARSVDRNQHLRVAQLYWDCSIASLGQRQCTLALEKLDNLERSLASASPRPAGASDMALLEAQRSDARARLAQADARLAVARRKLATVLTAEVRTGMPIAADPPHVGAYRTRFDELFAARPAPADAVLLNETLAGRHLALVARAEAVLAGEDALTAAESALMLGILDVREVLNCHASLAHQQREFLAVLRQYNHEIATYAFAVIPQGLSAERIAGVLIVPGGRRSLAGAGEHRIPIRSNPDVARAGYDAPTESGVSGHPAAAQNAGTPDEPPIVVPAEALEAGENDAVRLEETTLDERTDIADSPTETSRPEDDARFDLEAPPIASPPNDGTADFVAPPVESEFDQQASSEPPAEGTFGLYAGLVDLEPQARLDALAEWLSWSEPGDELRVVAVKLEECLTGVRPPGRSAVMTAYWRAAHHAAMVQCLAWRVDEYERLAPLVLAQRNAPGGPELMLRLQAHRDAAEADLQQAKTAWIESRFELTRACGRPLDTAWLVASTHPATEKLKDRTASSTASLQRPRSLAADGSVLAPLHEAMLSRAAAVVQCDAAVRLASETAGSDVLASGDILDNLERQTTQTLAFLEALEEYNRAAGQTVLDTLGHQAPAQEIVARLGMRN